MARYKSTDSSPRLLPVDLAQQLIPGTFEHALDGLLDGELDLSAFDARVHNDETGAPAYSPAVLLKAILFGYSRGLVSSRAIERACRENVVFIALTRDSAPHFTTISSFIRSCGDEIARLFAQVLYLCDRQGLIGREMFAIDGVKLPSNASKSRSGTRAEFERQAKRLEATAARILDRHQRNDAQVTNSEDSANERVERLQREAAQLREWLAQNPDDRRGSRGSIRKSNRTDADSAKMATSKGVIQGFTGVAAVDAKHQVIVDAQAHGTGSEQELLLPVVEAIAPLLAESSLVTADAGYHSDANLRQLESLGVDALIADNNMRSRDERFADQARHRRTPDPLHDKSATPTVGKKFTPADFTYDPLRQTCVCPAGKALYRNGRNVVSNGYIGVKFRGAESTCRSCPVRERCLRTPEKTVTRQVVFFRGKADSSAESATDRMKRRIDSPEGRARYGRRFAVVEPVFGNLRHNKRLNRFTLRGRRKVDTQWKLYCMVHNIEKLAKHRPRT
jgi:transposase